MFCARIKQLREQSGLTQRALSAEMGININTLASYEKGSREPNFSTLVKFAMYFNCTTDYLLGLSDDANEDDKSERVRIDETLGNSLKALSGVTRKSFILTLVSILDSYNALVGMGEKGLGVLLKQYVAAFAYYIKITTNVMFDLRTRAVGKSETKNEILLQYYRESNECVNHFNELSKVATNMLLELSAVVGDTNADTEE